MLKRLQVNRKFAI